MINQLIIWFSLLPIGIGILLWFGLKNHVTWHGNKIVPVKVGIIFAIAGLLATTAAFYGSAAVATADVEIWNGKVLGKDRVHDTYEESYSCNCRTTGSGQNQTATCDTCYETHYTVEWTCSTTVGDIRIDKKDSTSRSVYKTPNSAFFDSIGLGDPAAKRHTYTNYVQAVPQSLFAASPKELRKRFAGLVPAYPDQVYNFFKINRFLTPGYSTPDAARWNNDISMMLRDLGPTKQVNAIVVVAKTNDPEYEYALQDAWEGVNKNDVVLLIGSAAWPKIDFVRVISWTKNELFKIELRDNVQNLGTIQREPVMKLLSAQIAKNFERRHMAEFEYLKAEIDPPTWIIIALLCVLLIGAAGTFFLTFTFLTGTVHSIVRPFMKKKPRRL